MNQLAKHLDEVTRYWDSVADRYLELFRHELRNKPYDRDILRSFAQSLGPGGRVCDIGCGPCAHVSRLLATQGLEVTGIDISPRCVKLAREEEPSLKFQVMNMAQMTFGDGYFGGLVAYYALHYFPKSKLPSVVREFARVSRPRGHLLLVAKEGDGEGLIDDPLGSGQQVFWCAIAADQLEALVAENGFRVLNCAVREPLADEIASRRIYVTAEAI